MRFAANIVLAWSLLTCLSANAAFVSSTNCPGARDCVITASLPNPNDGMLPAWDEMQNAISTEDQRADRAFDPNTDFITDLGNGEFLIKAGTIAPSHNSHRGPGKGSSSRVSATNNLDSWLFALMAADQNLVDCDAVLGPPGLDVNDFTDRGLEDDDTTPFKGENAGNKWQASGPGDRKHLKKAHSPGGTINVPEPSSVLLLLMGLLGMGFAARKKQA